MTNITIKIDGATAHKLGQQGALTTGMVGATVAFEFSPEWDGLIKTAVFRGGGVTRDLVGIGDTAPIPPEVLQADGYLAVGVEGYDAEHTLVIPTTWENAAAYIHAGANASGDPAADPTLPIWAQLQAMIGDLSALDTNTKNNLVAAINELAAKSGGTVDDEAVAKLVEQYLATNPLEESDPTVPAWAKQPKKPSYTADEVGALPKSTPIPATAHDIGAIPAPSTAEVGQTNVVKAVDENGKPVEWEYVDVNGGCTFYASTTLDGTVSQVIFSQDENGNPMALDEVWIRIKYVGQTQYLSTWMNDTLVSYRHALNGSTNPIYETQHYTRFGDSVYGIIHTSTGEEISGMNSAFKGGGISKFFLDGKKIEKITVGSRYDDLLAEGTEVEIFGR